MRLRVDHLRHALYLAPLLIALIAGCASAPAAQSGELDTAAEARLITATAATRRLHVIFDWSAQDPSVNMSGRGVLRLDRGERGRLDLFGPRGETLMAAVLENEQMRIVPAFASTMLPPAPLMWSTLGVFRRPAEAPLTRTAEERDAVVLEYARDGTRWRFRFVGDTLRSTEWTSGAGRRTVELSGNAGLGVPREVTFRDHTEFRQLSLKVTNVEEVQGFDPDVWILPGER